MGKSTCIGVLSINHTNIIQHFVCQNTLQKVKQTSALSFFSCVCVCGGGGRVFYSFLFVWGGGGGGLVSITTRKTSKCLEYILGTAAFSSV